MDRRRLADAVGAWYRRQARDLPWRRAGVTPWGVMISEYMLQQTPVARVLGPWSDWLERWPTPAALAGAPSADAVRAWGRLGYPRRALRLHQAAGLIVTRHGGAVPAGLAELRALPGVGEYTAAAIASFAFGARAVVLDTNVRRVLARVEGGEAGPGPSLNRAERERAERWLPADPASAARWAVAAMELGSQVCLAVRPLCEQCPLAADCAWLRAGRPTATRPRRVQSYEGTDRQCRGTLLQALRASSEPIPPRQTPGGLAAGGSGRSVLGGPSRRGSDPEFTPGLPPVRVVARRVPWKPDRPRGRHEQSLRFA